MILQEDLGSGDSLYVRPGFPPLVDQLNIFGRDKDHFRFVQENQPAVKSRPIRRSAERGALMKHSSF